MEKRYIAYTIILVVCIVAIGIGVYQQFFYKNSTTDALMIGSTSATRQAEIEEKENAVKDDFNNIFTNSLVYITENFHSNVVKQDASNDIIYTVNHYAKAEPGKYEMNINLPGLNINTEVADTINNQIEDTFLPKANSLLTTTVTTYTIYNIDYAGFITNDIASLVVRATLKEGNNPQRVMYMTYNYNLSTNALVKLSDILTMKNKTKENLQAKINKEIAEICKKNADFKNIGYTVYERNPNDVMYNVDRVRFYFLGPNGYAYILFAYGNTNNTSEVDVILI